MGQSLRSMLDRIDSTMFATVVSLCRHDVSSRLRRDSTVNHDDLFWFL